MIEHVFAGTERAQAADALEAGGVLIVGSAGSGKTQLLTELGARDEQRGRRVLRCRGHRHGPATGTPSLVDGDLDAALAAVGEQPTTVLVDDAHLLPDPIAAVIAACVERIGVFDLHVAVTRRPVASTPAQAAIDEPLLRLRRVVHLPSVASEDIELASARLALLDDGARRALVPLAFGIPAGSAAWATASEATMADLDAALDGARAEGLVASDEPLDHDTLWPAVATALRQTTSFTQRVAIADGAAAAASPAIRSNVARHLLALGDATPNAGTLYATAAEDVVAEHPRLAVELLDAALACGLGVVTLAPLRLRALLGAGEPAQVVALATDLPELDDSMQALVATAWTRLGRASDAVEALLVGEPSDTEARVDLAAGARAWLAGDLALAAEHLERSARGAELLGGVGAWPDTPHALATLLALGRLEIGAANGIAERAVHSQLGAPATAARHSLLRGLVALRAGRVDDARADLESATNDPLSGRDALVAATLAAGIAFRAGAPDDLPAAQRAVDDALARATFDLWHTELLSEVGQISARVGQDPSAHFGSLEQLAARHGNPAPFRVSLAWARLLTAVAHGPGDETAAANAASAAALQLEALQDDLPDPGRTLASAARVFADVLAGRVDVTVVQATVTALADRGLVHEASRLAGAAGLRSRDATAAKSLLVESRRLRPNRMRGGAGGDVTALSEREIEIAREVIAGHTHRDIGAKLFISAKTVEHHVARIRQKLAASSRAEMLARLHDYLARLETPVA